MMNLHVVIAAIAALATSGAAAQTATCTNDGTASEYPHGKAIESDCKKFPTPYPCQAPFEIDLSTLQKDPQNYRTDKEANPFLIIERATGRYSRTRDIGDSHFIFTGTCQLKDKKPVL